MKKLLLSLSLVFLVAATANAIPSLQVGAPAGPGDSGIYADYQGSLTGPTETDTAITSGTTLLAAGKFDNGVENLGGQYGIGRNWSDFGFNTAFDNAGALLMATTIYSAGASLSINGNTSIYSTSHYDEDGYFILPSELQNHAPQNKYADEQYMFFDIGDFTKPASKITMCNFADETCSQGYGEVKTLTLATSGYDWLHFDLLALETDINGNTIIKITVLEGSPNSKDVTWKGNTPVPEPGTIMLLGSGLVGLAVLGRKRFKK